MRLYRTLARVAFADAMQYRIESAIFFLYESLPPIMMLFFWHAAYETQGDVAGYTRSDMVLYTLGVMVLRSTVSVHIEWALDYNIREGQLSTQLVRPFNYWAFIFLESLVYKLTRVTLSVPVVILAASWFAPSVNLSILTPDKLLLLPLSMALSLLVCFYLKICIGCISFWTNDIVGPTVLYMVVTNIIGGVLIPVALLPDWLQTVSQMLPMYAIYAVPLAILLGNSQGSAAFCSIGMQLMWIGILFSLATIMWRAGLRQYESVGR